MDHHFGGEHYRSVIPEAATLFPVDPSQTSFPEVAQQLSQTESSILHLERLQLDDFSNAFSRLILVSVLLIFNLFEILRSVFFRKQSHCVHSCVYSALLLISNIYLLWWLPYLFTSYRFGTILPVMTSLSMYCGLQHKFSLELSTSILVILAFRALFESFSRSRAKFLAQAIFIIWIIPQFIYSAILEFSSHANVLYMVDGLHAPEVPILYSTDSGFEFSTGNAFQSFGNSNNKLIINNNGSLPVVGRESTSGEQTGSGVLFCVHKLSTNVVHGMSWHYVALVVPLTCLLIICIGAKRFTSSFSPSSSSSRSSASTLQLPYSSPAKGMKVVMASGHGYRTTALPIDCPPKCCHCSTDIIVTTILFGNFAWLLVGRPLTALIKLLEHEHQLAAHMQEQNYQDHLDDYPPVDNASSNSTDSSTLSNSTVASSLLSPDSWNDNLFSSSSYPSPYPLPDAQSFILDFGTHLLLFMVVILLPFSRQFGLLASQSKSSF